MSSYLVYIYLSSSSKRRKRFQFWLIQEKLEIYIDIIIIIIRSTTSLVGLFTDQNWNILLASVVQLQLPEKSQVSGILFNSWINPFDLAIFSFLIKRANCVEYKLN